MNDHARIIAFLLTRNSSEDPGHVRAEHHLRRLASGFNLAVSSRERHGFRLLLCHEGDISSTLGVCPDDMLSFYVGPCLRQLNQASERDSYGSQVNAVKDRFLKISFGNGDVSITTDYAATIPCFSSTRSYFSISNLEPLVVLDSNSTLDDMDVSSIYAFLRYSHLIWDRTLYKHIRLQEPDSTLTWGSGGLKTLRLQTIRASNERTGLSDTQVANELYELNQELVAGALTWPASIILPLSAGYDSRMILSSCATNDDLRAKFRARTYGPPASIEVKAARNLCRRYQVDWQRVDLPCRFLSHEYLKKIGAIFGSSLHFHGMYQLEFADTIPGGVSGGVFTSGFMTGVPAGQHVSLMHVTSPRASLTRVMNRFSQSQTWTDNDLQQLSPLFRSDMLDETDDEFRRAFDRFQGELIHKSVVFDLWTRQRNFIAYHPRTLEWIAPIISPHMCPQYVNFFLSLSPRHLTDRRAVELMFTHHYPMSAKVPSNSNGLKALAGFYNFGLRLSRIARRLHCESLIPEMFVDQALDFDSKAIRHSGSAGVWPIFHLDSCGSEFLQALFPEAALQELLGRAMAGSARDYDRLAYIQAIAYGVGLVTRSFGEDEDFPPPPDSGLRPGRILESSAFSDESDRRRRAVRGVS